jgi:hypothetical protein
MEYLMTYGWAILVVIIVGIVLWQSGVFGTGSGGVSGFDKVRVQDYTFGSTGLQVVFENAAGATMRSVIVNASTNNGASYLYNMSLTPGGNWAPGKEYTATTADAALIATCASAGAGYKLDFKVVYASESNVNHTEYGTIRGKCE